MDGTPSVGYDGSFMALLTALDTRPTGAMSGLLAMDMLQTAAHGYVAGPTVAQGNAGSSTTTDMLQEGMDVVSQGNAGSTTTMPEGMDVVALGVPGSSTMSEFRTPKKSLRDSSILHGHTPCGTPQDHIKIRKF